MERKCEYCKYYGNEYFYKGSCQMVHKFLIVTVLDDSGLDIYFNKDFCCKYFESITKEK